MKQKRIEALITKAKETSFSGHILMVDQHAHIHEWCIGFENRHTQTPITSQSVFAIASGTKFLTALAIGRLINQGLVSLDTYANSIVDLKIPGYRTDIQIKHLLSHTSGMPDYLDESKDPDPHALNIDNQKLLTTKDYLTYFPAQPMDFLPGTRFKYHNGAYVYLALIIEKLTGSTYQDHINQVILKPLGITKSGIFSASTNMPNKVMGYLDQTRQNTHIGHIPEMAGGDGGAYMNAYDFKKVADAFLDGRIISHELVKAFMTPVATANLEHGIHYGLGLWLKQTGDIFMPYIEGGDAGVSFKCVFHPERRGYYWMVSNTGEGVWKLVDMFDQVAFPHIKK